jgi:predicted GH43/DUF377 family glycosyl hydrolase
MSSKPLILPKTDMFALTSRASLSSWIFEPEADYERDGDVHDGVFPCGYTLASDGDTINLHYGSSEILSFWC